MGVIVGFGAGYYLGAKAGRERYEQLNVMMGKIKRTEAYDTATGKAKAVVDLSVERAKDFVEEHSPNGQGTTTVTGV
jgi:hypothetical protein